MGRSRKLSRQVERKRPDTAPWERTAQGEAEEEQDLQREAGERGSGAGGGALEAINESEPQTSCWLTPGKDQTFLLQYGGTDVHPPPPGVLKGT